MRRSRLAAGAAAAAAAAASVLLATALPAQSAASVLVDAGATKNVVAADGQTYVRSTGFTGGKAGSLPKLAVTGRLGDAVLRTTWVGMSRWSAVVPNGRYEVTLAMAETYWTAKGKRVFSATAEGVTMFTALDLFATAGARTEVDRALVVDVVDGRIDLAFTATVDKAMVSAIAVVPVAPSPSPTPAPTTSTPAPDPTTASPPATTTATTPVEPPVSSTTVDPTTLPATTDAGSPSTTLPVESTTTVAAPTTSGAAPAAVLAATGDLVCDPADVDFNGGLGTAANCRGAAVSDLLVADQTVTAFAPLGDNAYDNGRLRDFQNVYAPTFGRVLDRTIPVAGNHEYYTGGAAGYFGYFGARAGDPAKGYYSTDLGGWHVVVLNTNCANVGGCTATSLQGVWLAADLAASTARCTVVMAHHPFRSSGEHGNTTGIVPLWELAYDGGADVVLVSHDHDYERFAPMGRSFGVVADGAGMRQFVVGTGGKGLRPFQAVAKAGSEVRESATYGYLRLALGDGTYTWDFAGLPGSTFADTGTGTCR
ncbi:MAG: metallophosphoesterase [Actinobacteria bacterium]|nr:metallophosphoesterase [Actinomycetota bacterium]